MLTLEHAFQQSHHHSQTCSANLLAHLCCTKLHQWLHKRTCCMHTSIHALFYFVVTLWTGPSGNLSATRGCCIRDAMPTQIYRTHRCVKHRQAPIHQTKKNMHRDCHLNNCDPFPEDGSFTTPCHQFVLPPAALWRSVKRVLLPKFVQLHRKAVPIRDLLDVLGEIRC